MRLIERAAHGLAAWHWRKPTWTQNDLASAWRKKQIEHVTRLPADLTMAEDAAWRANMRARRSAFNWGE